MSNYNSLKTTIDANIKQNGRQEITGQILNSVLNQMVTTLGAGYQFAGVATIDTNPGAPDAKVFYIANGKGTYTNFSGIEVTEDEVVVLYWDSSWHKVSTGIASNEKLTELEWKVNDLNAELDFTWDVRTGDTLKIVTYSASLGDELTISIKNSSTSDASIAVGKNGTEGNVVPTTLIAAGTTSTFSYTANSNILSLVFSALSRSIFDIAVVGFGITQRVAFNTTRIEDLEVKESQNEADIEHVLNIAQKANDAIFNDLEGVFDATGTKPTLLELPYSLSVGRSILIKIKNIGTSAKFALSVKYKDTGNSAFLISNETIAVGETRVVVYNVDRDIMQISLYSIQRSKYEYGIYTENKIDVLADKINGKNVSYIFDSTGSKPTQPTTPISLYKGQRITISATNNGSSSSRFYIDAVGYRESDTFRLIDDTTLAVGDSISAEWISNFDVLYIKNVAITRGYIDININIDGAAKAAFDSVSEFKDVEQYPLTKLPSYIVNAMSYKPIGELSKGYLVLSVDDGAAELATYTIPMMNAKNVPWSACIMRNSVVMQNDEYRAILIDSVLNHKCEVAQHGTRKWTLYDERGLYELFQGDKAYFATFGIVVKGCSCPEHYMSPLIKVVAGGTYGMMRAGYDGYAPDGSVGGVGVYYDYYTSGARSNMFALSSFNIKDLTLDYLKAAVDYAIANKKILNVYWHDWDLPGDNKTLLENFIDYAKTTSITFATLGDIPMLK